ncbi:MAG: TIR domain-containing protein [Adhaeribacter sp.]
MDTALLKNYISNNKIEKAFEILINSTSHDPDLHNDVLALLARYNNVQRKVMLSIIDYREESQIINQINVALLEIIKLIEKSNIITVLTNQRKVFISYNHHDKDTAVMLKEKLESVNIKVIIDNENMSAGADIKKFIEESICEAQTTLSIISKKSLLSSWVAMESVNTFYYKKINDNKKFIACYLEDDFLQRKFTGYALKSIEKEIKKIQMLITSRFQKSQSIRDLENELNRMMELRNNIDEIVRQLRESLCIDIRQEKLELNLHKIVQAIQL